MLVFKKALKNIFTECIITIMSTFPGRRKAFHKLYFYDVHSSTISQTVHVFILTFCHYLPTFSYYLYFSYSRSLSFIIRKNMFQTLFHGRIKHVLIWKRIDFMPECRSFRHQLAFSPSCSCLFSGMFRSANYAIFRAFSWHLDIF